MKKVWRWEEWGFIFGLEISLKEWSMLACFHHPPPPPPPKWLHIKCKQTVSMKGSRDIFLVWRAFEMEVPGSTQDAILPFTLRNRFMTLLFTRLGPRELILILMFYNVVIKILLALTCGKDTLILPPPGWLLWSCLRSRTSAQTKFLLWFYALLDQIIS